MLALIGAGDGVGGGVVQANMPADSVTFIVSDGGT